MKKPRSLEARLALWLGAILTALWLAAATTTAILVNHEMDEVFDSALQETAQRILPLAVVEIVGREEQGVTQRLADVREHGEFFTYVVRDDQGRVLLQSHTAALDLFPVWDGTGFRQSPTHRFYNEDALQGSIRITVAEPLNHRAEAANRIRMGLGLPLLVVIPLALLAIILAVRASLAPLRRFRDRLADRHARDLTLVPAGDLPSEIAPVAATVNSLLDRLAAAFEAERSFAANAAHELRTPLAGAIAQAQRLRSETTDAAAAKRAQDIEQSLKRLTRTSERLMELSRAEGAPLRIAQPYDLRPVMHLVLSDLARQPQGGRVETSMPAAAVMTDLDPDAFAIVCRNLVENALRHGSMTGPVRVDLSAERVFSVANDGPVVAPEVLARLIGRFQRGTSSAEGSGLGLAIVAAIADRLGQEFVLRSPRSGQDSGFEARFGIPGAP